MMQSSVPELIAGLCPEYAQIELYNEKEEPIPMHKHWDIVFFSYLHAYYEHTKVLSVIFRKRGMVTVAGGRHATHFYADCQKYFDAVVLGEPELNVPELIRDFENKKLKNLYKNISLEPVQFQPYRYDLVDFRSNRKRLPAIEASRGCPFACNFCVLSGWETYRYTPIKRIVDEIEFRMRWNNNLFGILDNAFVFHDNNLGGSPQFLRELCEALVPLKKTWGCAVTFNILKDEQLIKLMARAGCRYIYTGLESLNPESIKSMNKRQNRNNLRELDQIIQRTYSNGILLSFGLLVGFDGDTNEYLQKIPDYLSDLKYFSVTFIGIVCPYPETQFYRGLCEEGRMLPGVISRDCDGYTLCHKPKQLDPSEVVDHFTSLCQSVGSFTNIVKHYWSKLWMSDTSRYKSAVLFSGTEISSVRSPLQNRHRKYIAGMDRIETWDAEMMEDLQIPVQRFS